MEESLEEARACVRTALHEIEEIMDETQEAHNIFLAKNITLKRTLKSARSHLLALQDAFDLKKT